MSLHTILIAADQSDEGRHAARIAARLAARTGAELIVLRVVQGLEGPTASDGELLEARRSLQHWLGSTLAAEAPGVPVEYVVRGGLPHIEICRCAEDTGADLLVLGRKRRSQKARFFLGDTADAAARRSRVPCLFVPLDCESIDYLVAALDGTDRGFQVFRRAAELARALRRNVRLVTVEPRRAGESSALGDQPPSGRTARLHQLLRRQPPAAAETEGAVGLVEHPLTSLHVRRGDPVTEIASELSESHADVLVIGYHRGGPPGVLDGTSVARRLVHTAPCCVLTVPL